MTYSHPHSINSNNCVPPLQSGQDKITLYFEGDELYDAMLADIANAQNSIQLESYIFASDEIGWCFARALAERVAAGVDVRLHLDAAGFFSWGAGKLKNWLRAQGVKVRVFHRWQWRAPWRYNQRNHRKLLIIDDNKLYLGGFNIHRESSFLAYGAMRWRDTHLSLNGTIAHMAGMLFDDFWKAQRHSLPIEKNAVSMLIPNFNRRCRQVLKCLYANSFQQAKKSINLTTPYFVPDRHTQKNLQAAAQRGVDVRLLVPRKNDHALVQWASRAAYAKLLDAGVRIYEYLPRMLHAKTAVVDGNWAIVGTANLDYRSLFVNHEINLTSMDHSFCTQLEMQFKIDLEESEEVCNQQWSKRRWRAHFAELIGWLARRWL